MTLQLQSSDTQIMRQIAEHANKQFLKESRVHRRSSFNIIRMLSSFKEVSTEFSLRKEHIYNLIIYITKQYNPQTLKQWLHAINDMSSLSTNYQSRQSINEPKIKKRVNTVINQLYRDSDSQNLQKYSSRHLTTRLNSNFEMHRNKNNEADHIQAPLSCKMHYVSFEPDKENINHENMKDQNQFSRTPAEQSFILNLPNSYGSPFYLSKITNNTKQVVDVEETVVDEEWYNMKLRADIFYSINAKMKSFSALMANFQAYEEYLEIKTKAQTAYRGIVFHRFIQNLSFNCLHTKNQKSLNFKISQFYTNNLKKKSFKILKVYYELKIYDGKKIKFDVSKANPINFQFLLTLMLGPLVHREGDSLASSQFETPKSIRHKTKYFQQTQNCQKIQLIFQFFSKNFKLSKSQISQIFRQHHQSKMRKCFSILNKNLSKRQLLVKEIKQMIKKNTLSKMHSIIKENNLAGGQILTIKALKNKKIKEICFKALLEVALSKKIYSKRQQYLRQKNKQISQKSIFQQWRKKLQMRYLHKLTFQEKAKQACTIITNVLTKKYFQIVLKSYETTLQQQNYFKEQRRNSVLNKVFLVLKERVHQKKIYLSIKNIQVKKVQQLVMNNWEKIFKISKAIKFLSFWSNQQIFNLIKSKSQLENKSELLEHQLRNQYIQKFYSQLRKNYHFDKIIEQKKCKKVQKNIIKKNCLQTFVKISKNQMLMNKKIKEQQIMEQKHLNFVKYLEIKKKNETIKNLRDKKDWKQSIDKKMIIVKKIMTEQQKSIIFKNFMSNKSMKTQKLKFSLFLFKSTIFNQKQFFVFLSQNAQLNYKRRSLEQYLNKRKKERIVKQNFQQVIRQNKCERKVLQIRERKFNSTKKKVIQSLQETKELNLDKIYIIQNKINQRLLGNGVMALAKMVLRKQQKCLSLKNNIKSQHIIHGSKKFIGNLKIQYNYQIKNKVKLLRKTIYFNTFRSKIQKRNDDIKKMKEIQKMRKCEFLQKLYRMNNQKEWKTMLKKDVSYKSKKLAVDKVNRAIRRQLLRKKQICMAIKFRAIHLCKMSFKVLSCSCFDQSLNQTSQLMPIMINRQVKEHFSTDYSSI